MLSQPFSCRNLHTLDELKRVVELETIVWEYTDLQDVVPVPILAINVKRGGILLGAFDESEAMVGFAYSLPGLKSGHLIQWSHMVGVLEAHRNTGLGRLLKLEQRKRALEMGIKVIEWTFDPMQSMNAHFNLTKLGAVIIEYAENIYGESSSSLHRGTPTDRFVAGWNLESSRVLTRIAGTTEDRPIASELPLINETNVEDAWLTFKSWDSKLTQPRLRVEIPTGFGEMQRSSPDRARDWRTASRNMFTTYMARGYQVVEFVFDRAAGRGWYFLER
tara:strand:- start:56 stop:883 length:828 start_codon:yes stop_codon:yes gene_type:complete